MLGKQIGRDGGNDAESDGAAEEIFLLRKVAAGGFELAKNGAGAREKGLADLGETHGAAKAIEEAGAEFVFELTDLLGKRGLGDVGLAGSAAEAAGIDDGAEIAELVEFHGRVIRC